MPGRKGSRADTVVTTSFPLQATATGVRIRFHVQPRAATTALAGFHGDRLKVRVAAPPVEGAANEALVRFLAELLRVARSAVRVESGAGSRAKLVTIEGIDPEVARRRLGL